MTDLSTEAIMRLIAQQVPQMARAAVQIPTIRLGTVNQTSDPAVNYVEVQVDGDPTPISVMNGLGHAIAAGQRVAIQFYPPHGAIVVGALLPLYPLEQWWETEITATTGVETASSSWTLLTANGMGWHDAGGDLVCDVAGQWELTLHSGWTTDSSGTYRAVRLDDATPTPQVAVSEQFAAPGGVTTTGFGLAKAGFDVRDFDLAASLTAQAKQNTAGDLDVRVLVRLRLLGPTA